MLNDDVGKAEAAVVVVEVLSDSLFVDMEYFDYYMLWVVLGQQH